MQSGPLKFPSRQFMLLYDRVGKTYQLMIKRPLPKQGNNPSYVVFTTKGCATHYFKKDAYHPIVSQLFQANKWAGAKDRPGWVRNDHINGKYAIVCMSKARVSVFAFDNNDYTINGAKIIPDDLPPPEQFMFSGSGHDGSYDPTSPKWGLELFTLEENSECAIDKDEIEQIHKLAITSIAEYNTLRANYHNKMATPKIPRPPFGKAKAAVPPTSPPTLNFNRAPRQLRASPSGAGEAETDTRTVHKKLTDYDFHIEFHFLQQGAEMVLCFVDGTDASKGIPRTAGNDITKMFREYTHGNRVYYAPNVAWVHSQLEQQDTHATASVLSTLDNMFETPPANPNTPTSSSAPPLSSLSPVHTPQPMYQNFDDFSSEIDAMIKNINVPQTLQECNTLDELVLFGSMKGPSTKDMLDRGYQLVFYRDEWKNDNTNTLDYYDTFAAVDKERVLNEIREKFETCNTQHERQKLTDRYGNFVPEELDKTTHDRIESNEK